MPVFLVNLLRSSSNVVFWVCTVYREFSYLHGCCCHQQVHNASMCPGNKKCVFVLVLCVLFGFLLAKCLVCIPCYYTSLTSCKHLRLE